jgi:hypothetical protein
VKAIARGVVRKGQGFIPWLIVKHGQHQEAIIGPYIEKEADFQHWAQRFIKDTEGGVEIDQNVLMFLAHFLTM